MNSVKLRVPAGEESSSSYRVLLFVALGLLVCVHGATRGRRDWALRYDGSFARISSARAARPGVTVTLGVGTSHAVATGAACILLLVAYFTLRRWLALPALLLALCDLQDDTSNALVATWLLQRHSGNMAAAVYGLVASAVIALELYLWRGVLCWYERGLALQVKQLDRQLRERAPPSVASSVSSVMG